MSAVAMPLLTIVAMLFVDWRLALLLVVPIVLSFVLLGSALGSPEGSACQVAMAHSLERMNGTTVEYVHGMPVVKVFNRGDGAFARLEEDAREFVGNVKWATWFNARGMGKLYAAIGTQMLFLLPAVIFLAATATPYEEFVSKALLSSRVPLMLPARSRLRRRESLSGGSWIPSSIHALTISRNPAV